MAIEHVAVVGGGGVMGSGIAQVVAQAGPAPSRSSRSTTRRSSAA